MQSEDRPCIAILASGTGSNANTICAYFKHHPTIKVGLVITNRIHAGVRDIAAHHLIPDLYFPRSQWTQPAAILDALQSYRITHIVLAGFLLLLPESIIQAYPGRIINIHPALLPRHGGQGMYGHHVHAAVKAAGDQISGITIHAVNEKYDDGQILFQEEVQLQPDDTPSDIGRRVLELEHRFYPEVIEHWILG